SPRGAVFKSTHGGLKVCPQKGGQFMRMFSGTAESRGISGCCPQFNWNMRVSAASMPPMETWRWYQPAAARGRSLSQVSTDDLVRSHSKGVTLETLWPASICTTWSLDSVWQSVDRHHVSLPLVISNFWVDVPTFMMHASAPS